MNDKYVSHFDLHRLLSGMASAGVPVPCLNSSNIIPPDFGTRELPPGCVMDDHGNVVDLDALRQACASALEKERKKEPWHAPRDEPVCGKPDDIMATYLTGGRRDDDGFRLHR